MNITVTTLDGIHNWGFMRGLELSSIHYYAQRAESRFLSLGQSSDSGDIEPFIGSVTPESLKIFSGSKIPQHDSSIIPTTYQSSSICTSPQ